MRISLSKTNGLKMKKITIDNLLPNVFAAQADTIGSDIWLKRVDFNKGETVLIEAASGKGKSSLAAFLFGYRKDYQGNILFDGKDTKELDKKDWAKIRKTSISMMFQELRLFPELTAMKNIEMKRPLADYSDAYVDELFRLLGIEELKDRPCGLMSYGQQQRVAFIRALVQPFDFLIADEPISHLDDENAEIMADIITRLTKLTGAGVIITSIGKTLPLHYDRILKL